MQTDGNRESPYRAMPYGAMNSPLKPAAKHQPARKKLGSEPPETVDIHHHAATATVSCSKRQKATLRNPEHRFQLPIAYIS